MKSAGSRVLTINGGSSSIKFALFEVGAALRRILGGELERIGRSGDHLAGDGLEPGGQFFAAGDGGGSYGGSRRPDGVASKNTAVVTHWPRSGHRVVHGGPKYSEPQQVTAEMVEELHRLSPFDPEHLPLEIELIEAFRRRHPYIASGGVFRHRVSPHHAAGRHPAADSAPLRGAGRSPLWLPRFVV